MNSTFIFPLIFLQPTMVSPVSVPQQLPLLPQQHHLLKPLELSPTFHGSSHQYGPHGKDFPTQIPGSSGNQVPRAMAPMTDLKECVQVGFLKFKANAPESKLNFLCCRVLVPDEEDPTFSSCRGCCICSDTRVQTFNVQYVHILPLEIS